LSYEWKVDFAILLALASLVATIVLYWLQASAKTREARLRAYEDVFEDVSWLLLHPHQLRKEGADRIQYDHPDPDFQAAVRAYLSAHWMERMWGQRTIVPTSIGENDRFEYFMKVMETAREHSDRQFHHRASIDVPEQSPVYYMDTAEFANRLEGVMRRVGARLSLFSANVRRHWEKARFMDPAEVRASYEAALRVCSEFFQHNTRDFDDPYCDLLLALRREYRELSTSVGTRVKWWLRGLQYTRPARAWSRLYWWLQDKCLRRNVTGAWSGRE
jgi:hypothetical protein